MATKIFMTALSPTMEQGTVVRWTKQIGEKVVAGQVICEIETDKATMDYESSDDGTLLKILVKEGQMAKVGEPIAIIGEPNEEIKQEITELPPAQINRVNASPLARKLAEQKRIDLKKVQGSGPHGRIIKRDIIKESPSAIISSPRVTASSTQPLSAKRKIIAERLSSSMFTAPHYYLTATVTVERLLQARTAINLKSNLKLSLNAFLLKIAAIALNRHPIVNAAIVGEQINYYPSCDIGLAVAIADGLITPIVRDCYNKGIKAIDAELKELIQLAQSGKLLPEQFNGATFTISNLGSFGVEQFTAIINPPGSAILAVGAAIKQPVVVEEDKIVARTQMKITLSCDHRIIDGAAGAQFLQDLKNMLEEPLEALL